MSGLAEDKNPSELPKAYEAKLVESKWAEFWEKRHFFKADPLSPKPGYCIVIPPPNVTGVLHMGHALVNTLQDILIRWKKKNRIGNFLRESCKRECDRQPKDLKLSVIDIEIAENGSVYALTLLQLFITLNCFEFRKKSIVKTKFIGSSFVSVSLLMA